MSQPIGSKRTRELEAQYGQRQLARRGNGVSPAEDSYQLARAEATA